MGEPRYVYDGKAPPLGARLGLPSGSRQVDIPLAAGAIVLFYTDGAIERRGERIDVGLARFAALADRPAPTLEARLDQILASIEEEEEGHTDDIAILAVEWHGPPS